MRLRITVLAILLMFASSSAAGAKDNKAKSFADAICEGKSIAWNEILDPAVISYMNEFDAETKLYSKRSDALGKCLSYKISGDRITFRHEKGRLYIEAIFSENGLVGLRRIYRGDSFEKIRTDMRELPGQVSATVKRGDGKVLYAYNEGMRLATGSTFKLYILKALLDDVKSGKRSWSDVIELDEEEYSLPSGIVQTWPDGSPVTLHTLATEMVSISDNTATDILIRVAGRGRLEKMMPGSVPFLKTKEMFIIKWDDRDRYRKLYLNSNLEGRREILKRIKSYNVNKIVPRLEKPIAIDRIEWFASSDELADLILSMKGEPILAVNPGVIYDAKKWNYIGFKGGSETGVVQYTQLLRSKFGEWYAISLTQNDTKEAVDEAHAASFVERLANMIR